MLDTVVYFDEDTEDLFNHYKNRRARLLQMVGDRCVGGFAIESTGEIDGCLSHRGCGTFPAVARRSGGIVSRSETRPQNRFAPR